MFNLQYKIKVCGMTEANNIREIEQLHPNLMGFIFYPPSPRYCKEKPSYLPTTAKRVGVFVDATKAEILDKVKDFGLDYVQLHGKESPEFCQELQQEGILLIKAFPISEASDIVITQAYEGLCEYFLFDTKTPKKGGSGEQFDWNLLQKYRGNTPFLLSGGIGLNCIDQLKDFQHPLLAGYDLNSKFETAPGIKDVTLLQRFINSFQNE